MNRLFPRKTAALSIAVAFCVLALGGGIASAGREQSGNVIVSLSGSISPHLLPRLQAAPATVHLNSSFETDDGKPLPALRRIYMSISSRGQVVTAGLPTCPLARIQATKASQALSACEGALVGHGVMWADAAIPGQRPVPMKGRMLLFNGRLRNGQRAVFADVHTKAPPASFVMPFTIRHNPTGSSILLVATLGRAAGTWGHVSRVDMTLGRRFEYRGRMRSFLEASCFAPPGFSGITFPLAHARYTFAGGLTVKTSAHTSCGVRR